MPQEPDAARRAPAHRLPGLQAAPDSRSANSIIIISSIIMIIIIIIIIIIGSSSSSSSSSSISVISTIKLIISTIITICVRIRLYMCVYPSSIWQV